MDFGIMTAKIDEISRPSSSRALPGGDARGGAGFEHVRELERQGLRAIMLYPPLNRQYRVIEDFAEGVMARL